MLNLAYIGQVEMAVGDVFEVHPPGGGDYGVASGPLPSKR